MSTTREEWASFVRAHAVNTVAERLALQSEELVQLRQEKADRLAEIEQVQTKLVGVREDIDAYIRRSVDLDELSTESLTAMARSLINAHNDPNPAASLAAYEKIIYEIEHRRRISDDDAMAKIHELLDGQSWTSDVMVRVADVVRETGRPVRDVSDVD